MDLCNEKLYSIKSAVISNEKINSLTHNYYKYPARFSPRFVRAIVETFTKPEELVLDPYMGGGTTLIESNYLGRNAIGFDINPLAVFVAQVKTTPLEPCEINYIKEWLYNLNIRLNLHNHIKSNENTDSFYYKKNINDRQTWPIRKSIELALARIELLEEENIRNFARCVILKTAQWALDGRKVIPKASQFRAQLYNNAEKMIESNNLYANHIRKQKKLYNFSSICIEKDAEQINSHNLYNECPKLIVTSPPYPGVHVLYHRWQVKGRKETPAPYWIIDCLDGKPEPHYTFGCRKQKFLSGYFNKAEKTFYSLSKISNQDTILVQLIAFSNKSWQLDAYLATMEKAGFTEVYFDALSNNSDGRLWRNVPNRKWYASKLESSDSSKEVVLFHKLKN